MDFHNNQGGGYQGGQGGGYQGGERFERKRFQGNWKCADCGAEITELPFEPRDGSNVRCLECYRKNKPPRRNFR